MAEAPLTDTPWLTIVGLGEDGLDGLPPASRRALEEAEVVMGPPRHLDLVPDDGAERVPWPVPFADGLPRLMALRGRSVVVLASGDPFWYGAGRVISEALDAAEWRALPGPSTFSLAAARLGWGIEKVACLGLHARPLARVRRHLAPGRRLILLLRDGAAVHALAELLTDLDFGQSRLVVMQALGGAREQICDGRAAAVEGDFEPPVCAAVEVEGDGAVIPVSQGIDDAFFENDGQITKRPVRALALSALGPRPGEVLWDIGGGSGSVALEWCLAGPAMRAITLERDRVRADRIRRNATALGIDTIRVVQGDAPDALDGLEPPHAVFIGGGLSRDLMVRLEARLPPGTRLVAHAVTLEAEALLSDAQARLGGDLLRVELSHSAPLGTKRGWKPSYPVVQWRAVL